MYDIPWPAKKGHLSTLQIVILKLLFTFQAGIDGDAVLGNVVEVSQSNGKLPSSSNDENGKIKKKKDGIAKLYDVLEKIAVQQAKQGQELTSLKDLINTQGIPTEQPISETVDSLPVCSSEDFEELEKKWPMKRSRRNWYIGFMLY